jgi:NAD(P)-dependent dehydrogenase (short-subunit alcohol dehydrogenase family)
MNALVTGATAGIGFHTAGALAAQGMRVIVTGRDPLRGERAAVDLRKQAGHEHVEFMVVDHSVVGANIALADKLTTHLDGLHVFVNNVGGPTPNDGRRRTVTKPPWRSTPSARLL